MKLSDRTSEILQNFSTINENLVVKPGSQLATISDSNALIATANVDETFDQEFGIYNLREFLSCFGLVENHEVEFTSKFARIHNDSTFVKYFYSDKDMLKYPTANITMPDADIEFTLTEADFASIRKAAGALGHDSLVIYYDVEEGALRGYLADSKDERNSVVDVTNRTANTYDFKIADMENPEAEFRFVLTISYLKFLNGSYDVSISSKNIAQFVHTRGDVTYFVALHKSSQYSG